VPEHTAVSHLNHAINLMREHLKQTADSMSTWYNRKVKLKDSVTGAAVRVYNPRRFNGRSPKWQSFYHEVGVVVNKLNDVTYIVKSSGWKKPKVVHVDKLKRISIPY